MARAPRRRDVFTGPATRAAIEAAKSVRPGRMELTAFTAHDTGDLIGLEGRSFIVKLPRNAPENARVHWTMRWYVGGTAVGRLRYASAWADWYVERTRCWLVDIGILTNWFSRRRTPEAMAFFRFTGLDADGMWMRAGGIKLAPPETYRPRGRPTFLFRQSPDRDIRTAMDIPVGAWFAWDDKANLVDPLDIAKAAPAACVFFLRFQKTNPKDKR